LPDSFYYHDPADQLLVKFGPRQNTVQFNTSASFFLRDGKYTDGILAVESAMFPGRFIRHAGFILRVHPDDGSPLFAADASWLALEKKKVDPPTGGVHHFLSVIAGAVAMFGSMCSCCLRCCHGICLKPPCPL